MIIKMKKHTIFIADLHLSPNAPQTIDLFFKFLNQLTEATDALYILGDLFQFWAGDDNCSNFNKQVKAA